MVNFFLDSSFMEYSSTHNSSQMNEDEEDDAMCQSIQVHVLHSDSNETPLTLKQILQHYAVHTN
jgi:hypothetical protein